jgi:hypothetical protein
VRIASRATMTYQCPPVRELTMHRLLKALAVGVVIACTVGVGLASCLEPPCRDMRVRGPTIQCPHSQHIAIPNGVGLECKCRP